MRFTSAGAATPSTEPTAPRVSGNAVVMAASASIPKTCKGDAAAPDTPVRVVDQPAKVGWSAGELYLEVHPARNDPASEDRASGAGSSIAKEADALIFAAAGRDAERLDWPAIDAAEARPLGVPVRVTTPPDAQHGGNGVPRWR